MRLTRTQLTAFREEQLKFQNGKCELCTEPVDSPVLDHCHKTGTIRGVLCRGCNAMLGHIENNAPRNKLTNLTKLARWAYNLVTYISKYRAYPRTELHPSHRTADEKRELRNKRARTARAKAK